MQGLVIAQAQKLPAAARCAEACGAVVFFLGGGRALQAPSLVPQRTVFAMTSFETQCGEGRRHDGRSRQGHLADSGIRKRGDDSETRKERQGADKGRGQKVRQRRGTKGCAPRSSMRAGAEPGRREFLRPPTAGIKNGLRQHAQAAEVPQRRRTISVSSGKQIPVPRQDEGSDARGSCVRSARWRLSDDRCIRGRACRARLLFCRCGGDSRS